MADLVEEGCTHVVLEVSSQAMITNRVDDIKFDIAGFTNFSEDHISKYEHHSLDEYFDANHLCVWHGRYTCKARKPECERCTITKYCNYFKIKNK